MKQIVCYIKDYWRESDKLILGISSLFIAILVWMNYSEGLEPYLLRKMNLPLPYFSGHLIIYSFAYFIPIFITAARKRVLIDLDSPFLLCILLAPILFAIKVSMSTDLQVAADNSWNKYWNNIAYWPLRFLCLCLLLIICWKAFHRTQPFYGLSAKAFKYPPYLLMLVIMIPLIALASTQHDFLQTYPKLKQVIPLPNSASPTWIYKLLFELSYGTDFLSIELFFRGFLVLGIMKWLGKDAILPMACFYCTIHFGKPLGECISSYFGGLLLGIVSYNTRSIYGGLMVHLGIAWLMELGGLVGNSWY